MSAAGLPLFASPAVKASSARVAQAPGGVSGIAKDSSGNNLPDVKVRVRDSKTGTLVAEVQTDATGAFSAPGIAPGTYVVEVVNAAGEVVGLSPAIAVLAGTTVSVTVTATALGAVTTAATGGIGFFGLGTAATVGVLGAATAATIVGVRAVKNTASPVR
jgi:hypothetical protein